MSYLRGQYTREVAKMKEKKSGAGAEENYLPSAYWYNEVTFLQDFIRIRKGCCNLDVSTMLISVIKFLFQILIFLWQTQVYALSDDSFDVSQLVACEESPQPNKRTRTTKSKSQSNPNLSQEDEVLTAATAVLQKIASNSKISPADERDDSFCNYIRNELFEIKSLTIKDELMESITIEVFKAKKKQRTLNSNNEDLNFLSFECQ